MLGLIEKCLRLPAIIIAVKTAFQRDKNKEPVRQFVKLFETHGVARTQMPRFLKNYGVEISLIDLVDDESLLKRLDEDLLNKACEIFAVRREWLDGVDKQIYPCHDFYKYPEQFSEFIKKLKTHNLDAQLKGVLLTSEKLDDDKALLILQETIGNIGDKAVYRYHLCNNWYFSYWKSRAYLTACIAIAWKQKVHVQGRYLSQKKIKQLACGETLLGWQGEGIWQFGGKHWYPEDMALLPEFFLKGVNPEQDSFGIKSALGLWLELDNKGLMDTGLGKNERHAFQNALTD